MTKITLTNDFHNTSVNVIVQGSADDIEYTLTDSQLKRASKALCGMSDCGCGTVRCDEWDVIDNGEGHINLLVNRTREHATAFAI